MTAPPKPLPLLLVSWGLWVLVTPVGWLLLGGRCQSFTLCHFGVPGKAEGGCLSPAAPKLALRGDAPAERDHQVPGVQVSEAREQVGQQCLRWAGGLQPLPSPAALPEPTLGAEWLLQMPLHRRGCPSALLLGHGERGWCREERRRYPGMEGQWRRREVNVKAVALQGLSPLLSPPELSLPLCLL